MIKFSIASRMALLLAAVNAVSITPTFAQEKLPKAGKKLKRGPLKQAEAILGRPLSPAQKAAVKKANATRKAQIAPIEARYNAAVAKALGLSITEYQAKQKALSSAPKR